jgi:hypothetical protein
MWRSLKLAVTSLHKNFHRLQFGRLYVHIMINSLYGVIYFNLNSTGTSI